ncbi:DUF4864 domain-containing protein [Pycnococcus provasolii]
MVDPFVLLPPTAFALALALSNSYNTARLVSKEWRDFVDVHRASVKFQANTPNTQLVKAVASKCCNYVQHVSLRNMAHLDNLDDAVIYIVETCKHLTTLDLARNSDQLGRHGGRKHILHALATHKALQNINLEGCWRVLTPHPRLSPTEVLSLQIAALSSDNSAAMHIDGIAAAYQFAAPLNREMTGPLPRFATMLTTMYVDLLRTKSFALRELDDGVLSRVSNAESESDYVEEHRRRYFLVETQVGVSPSLPTQQQQQEHLNGVGLTPMRAAAPPPPGSLHPSTVQSGAVVPWQGTRWFLWEMSRVAVDPATGEMRPSDDVSSMDVWTTSSVRGPVDYWIVRGLLCESGHGPLPRPTSTTGTLPSEKSKSDGVATESAVLTPTDISEMLRWRGVV